MIPFPAIDFVTSTRYILFSCRYFCAYVLGHMHTKMNKSNIKFCLLIFKTFSLYVELGFKPLYRIQRYYFFRYNLYTSANYFAFLLFFFAECISSCPFCSAELCHFAFLHPPCMAFMCITRAHRRNTVSYRTLYMLCIYPVIFKIVHFLLFTIGAKACLLPASRDIIPVCRQTAILAVCCFREGGYNPRRARKI